MSKKISYSIAIVAIIALIATSLTGLIQFGPLNTANAMMLEATVTNLEITQFAQTLDVGQEVQFEATVTYYDEEEDETYTDHIVDSWESSAPEIATVTETGLVTGIAEGTAIITAKVGDQEDSVTITVQAAKEPIHVVGIYLNKAMLVLRMNAEETLVATVVPADADNTSVTWASDNEDAATVADGVVTAKGIGVATISATTVDGEKVASCEVAVLPTNEATLNHAELTFMAVNAADQSLTVTLPEGVSAEGATYEWYSLYSDVASVDPDDADESICAVRPWRFGSTIVTVVVTLEDGTQYGAYSNVLVTSATFFITGEQNGWIGTPETDWNLQGTNGIYTIKASLWSYSGFQIIHNDIDTDWTTKITPWWYDVARSSYNYVANTSDMFEVTTYGVYDVTLDLTQGIAKVYIVFDYAHTTSVGLELAATSAKFLQDEGSFITLDITALPEGSVYDPADVRATVPEEYNTLISAQAEGENMTVLVTLLQAIPSTGEVTLVPITVYIGEAYAEFDVVIVPLGATLTDVISIEFSKESYELDVNNGADAAWEVPIRAFVNADASIQQVDYSVNSSNVYIDVDADGNAKLVAGALGTYTVTATSVGTTAEGEHLTKSVDVLIYSNAPYLIGTLNGETVNNWTALEPSVTSLKDTLFAPWALEPVDGSKAIYSITTDLNQNDVFSIVFLGMTGNWNGALRYANLNRTDSDMQYLSENDNNVQILERAKYTITMDLTSANPSFTVKYAGEADTDVDIDDLYVYILRAGDAWDGNATNVGNVLVASTEKVDVNEEGGIKTITLEYDFSNFGTAWPTIQFVTATEANAETGEFVNPTWYNSSVTTVEFSGTAFIAGDVTENAFTNGGSGCQLWLEGSLQYNTISFTFNFDYDGNITSIEMNYVVPVEA